VNHTCTLWPPSLKLPADAAVGHAPPPRHITAHESDPRPAEGAVSALAGRTDRIGRIRQARVLDPRPPRARRRPSHGRRARPTRPAPWTPPLRRAGGPCRAGGV